MARMLVIGSLDPSDQGPTAFLQSLGAEIADQGHHLLNGCRNDLDRIIAVSAFERLQAKGKDPSTLITSYVSQAAQPIHQCGTILKSRCQNWEDRKSTRLNSSHRL